MAGQYRVFHLIKGLGRGGAEKLLTEGRRFAGIDFTYGYGYFLQKKGDLLKELKADAEVVCFARNNQVSLLLSVHEVAAFLKKWKADVLHCHLPLAGVVGRWAGRRCGIPVVYTEHNLQERYHIATRYLNRWTWELQQRVIAVSSPVADSIHRHIKSKLPVDVVENGVAVDRFCRDPNAGGAIRAQLKIPPDAFVVGTVAVFRPSKNLKDWLKAARLILNERKDAHFLLVGDGLLRKELEAHSESLGLQGRVHFPGLQEEVLPYLSAMDIYLSSSVFEGLPVAVLEAMAVQLPVVATEVGGLPTVVMHGETGYLVQPGDPVALANAVLRLAENAQARLELGRTARKTVIERFSLKNTVRKVEDVYREILESKNSRSIASLEVR